MGIERDLERAFWGGWNDVGIIRPQMYPYDRVHLAQRTREAAGFAFGDDPRSLTDALRLRVVPMRTGACGGEVTDGLSVGVAWSPDRRVRGLLRLHAAAHALMVREKWDHSHGDVWMLTVELAVPADACRALDDDELVRLAHAPERVVRAWSGLSRKLGRRAASSAA